MSHNNASCIRENIYPCSLLNPVCSSSSLRAFLSFGLAKFDASLSVVTLKHCTLSPFNTSLILGLISFQVSYASSHSKKTGAQVSVSPQALQKGFVFALSLIIVNCFEIPICFMYSM